MATTRIEPPEDAVAPRRPSRRRLWILLGLVLAIPVVWVFLLQGGDTRPAAVPPAKTVPGPPPVSVEDGVQAATIRALKNQVSDIRGLAWKADVPVRVVSKAELADRVRTLTAEDFDERKEEVASLEATLRLLNLLPDDVSYRRATEELFAGGVLGFYDDETRQLFVGADAGSSDEVPSPLTRSTLVHELTHALTDQYFDFGPALEKLSEAGQTEEAAGLLAVVEGDAEIVRLLWEQKHLSPQDQARISGGDAQAGESVFNRAPPYLVASLLFPYSAGTAFVDRLRRDGGFAAVDRAYRKPPSSTAEVLHPELYRPEAPPPPPAPATPAAPPGCSMVDDGAVGEFDMRFLLDQELPQADAVRSADGWGGDRFALLRCGSSDALVDRWEAVSDRDAAELAAALRRWSSGWSGGGPPDTEGRFAGRGGAGRVVLNGAEVELVLAEDVTTRDLLAR